MLRLASALAASWQCQRCNCINDSTKNKRRCFSCRAWRDRIAPLSAAGIAIADAHRGGSTSFCSNKNDALNNASPCKVGSPKKRGAKRKSPSRGFQAAWYCICCHRHCHRLSDCRAASHLHRLCSVLQRCLWWLLWVDASLCCNLLPRTSNCVGLVGVYWELVWRES